MAPGPGSTPDVVYQLGPDHQLRPLPVHLRGDAGCCTVDYLMDWHSADFHPLGAGHLVWPGERCRSSPRGCPRGNNLNRRWLIHDEPLYAVLPDLPRPRCLYRDRDGDPVHAWPLGAIIIFQGEEVLGSFHHCVGGRNWWLGVSGYGPAIASSRRIRLDNTQHGLRDAFHLYPHQPPRTRAHPGS